MLLTDKDILEFQDMYRKRFGKELSKEEAYESAIRLIEFVQVVYQPLTEEDLKAVERSRQEIKEKLG